jgi:hypothetical protein
MVLLSTGFFSTVDEREMIERGGVGVALWGVMALVTRLLDVRVRTAVLTRDMILNPLTVAVNTHVVQIKARLRARTTAFDVSRPMARTALNSVNHSRNHGLISVVGSGRFLDREDIGPHPDSGVNRIFCSFLQVAEIIAFLSFFENCKKPC